MIEHTRTTWPGGLIQQIKTQPLRAAVLGALILLLGILWVRKFASGGSPSRAGAATVTGAKTAVSNASAKAENIPRSAVALREFLGRTPAAVRRNLFVVELDHFPADASKPASAAKGGGIWDELAKSIAAKADQEKARRILIENLQTQASKLNVQAILNGNASPRVLVDGKLAAVGEVVAGFKILKIESNRIVVEREGVRLEVRSSLN